MYVLPHVVRRGKQTDKQMSKTRLLYARSKLIFISDSRKGKAAIRTLNFAENQNKANQTEVNKSTYRRPKNVVMSLKQFRTGKKEVINV